MDSRLALHAGVDRRSLGRVSLSSKSIGSRYGLFGSEVTESGSYSVWVEDRVCARTVVVVVRPSVSVRVYVEGTTVLLKSLCSSLSLSPNP